MSERSGLGLLEVAVLEAVAECGAGPNQRFVKSAKIVGTLERTNGIAPDYGYAVLCDLAAPWLLRVPLVDGHGNFGSPDFEPSAPRYNEARLSPAGAMALDAELGGPPLPIGLINGDVHVGGQRPPFNPERLAATVERLLNGDDLTDVQLLDAVGPPEFPTGCEVEGDLSGLTRGEATPLRLSARLTQIEAISSHDRLRPAIVVSHLPPGIGGNQLIEVLTARARTPEWEPDEPDLATEARLPIADVADMTHGTWENTRLHVFLSSGVALDSLEAGLKKVWGITIDVRVQLPAPLAPLLRSWVAQHSDEADLRSGMRRFRAVL
ncbi:MAG: hypothetical protein M3256_27615 [Actinomycetota bacterium]|nr:hypothetical protein [Actinomycetota bacterium]